MLSWRFGEGHRLSSHPWTLSAGLFAFSVSLANAGCAWRSDEAGAADASMPDAEPVDACMPSDPVEDDGSGCRVIHVHLEVLDDSQQQPLFAEAAEVVLPGCAERVACRQVSRTSFACDLPGDVALDPPVGSERTEVEVITRVNGDEHRAPAELLIDYNALGRGPLCSYYGNVAVPLPACARHDALAVEGRVLGLAEDAALEVRLLPPWHSDGVFWDLGPASECVVERSTYRCPASGYQTRYVLEALVDRQIVAQRDVYVRSEGCQLETLRYDLDPAVCELEVWLGNDARAASADVTSVAIDAVDVEPGVTCQRTDFAQQLFRCPLTPQQAVNTRTVTAETAAGATLSKKTTYRRKCPAVFPMRSSTLPPEYGVPNVNFPDQELRELVLRDE